MKVLVVGNGGREHAIVDKVSQSSLVSKVYAAPGNYGIGLQAELVNLEITDNDGIVKFAQNNEIDLVIIGPETALLNGLSDELSKVGIKVFGPNKKAAQIESSKEYAKKIMDKYNIPTAGYESFDEYNKAVAYVKDKNAYPTVIKYDGLAAGKGVYIVNNEKEALYVLELMLKDKVLGDDGLIIEEFLEGDEFTLLSLVKGNKVYPFQAARDFKRVFDNDEGLNTGGMGAICPYHNIDDKTYQDAFNVLKKTAQAMVAEDNSFTGVLYGGFIKTDNGIKVIEFNARFGDPETQCVLNNLASDLVQNILDLLDNKEVKLEFKNQTSVGIVLSAPGYPGEYEKNIQLNEYLKLPYKIYHMQSKQENDNVLSNGGRVLFVLNEAENSRLGYIELYQELAKIANHTLHYRRDLMNY